MKLEQQEIFYVNSRVSLFGYVSSRFYNLVDLFLNLVILLIFKVLVPITIVWIIILLLKSITLMDLALLLNDQLKMIIILLEVISQFPRIKRFTFRNRWRLHRIIRWQTIWDNRESDRASEFWSNQCNHKNRDSTAECRWNQNLLHFSC